MRALGSCYKCGQTPIAFDAVACPRCGVYNPAPSPTTSKSNRVLLLCVGFGGLVGAPVGIAVHNEPLPGLFGGAILGLFGGTILGIFFAMCIRIGGRQR